MGPGPRLRQGGQGAWQDGRQVAPKHRCRGPGPGGPREVLGEAGACSQPAPEEALDLADGGLRTAPDWEKWGKFPLYHSCQCKARPCRSGRLGTGPWQKTPCLEMALGPGGRAQRPGNCPATPRGRKGSEKRRSVLLLGPRRGKTLSLYGFSSDQRQVGSSGKEQGKQGGWQWLHPGLGRHRALSPGQRDLASEWAGRMLPASPSLSLIHPQRVEAGERQIYSANPFSFRLW